MVGPKTYIKPCFIHCTDFRGILQQRNHNEDVIRIGQLCTVLESGNRDLEFANSGIITDLHFVSR